MVDMRRATFTATMKSGRAVMSTAKVDRVGDSIDVEGWDLSDFAANPVMLYEHRRDEPVGIWKNFGIENGALTGEPIFHPAELNPFAARLEGLYAGGWLRAFSVGFVPLEMEPIPQTDGYRIKRAKLIECSCVAVPANTDALMKAAPGARIVPVFAEKHPFATAEARLAGRKPEALTWLPTESTTTETKAAPETKAAQEQKTMTETEVRALFKTMLDEMKQPAAPQSEGNAPPAGADATDEDEDELAVKIAEAEADLAETEVLIAEIEDEA